MEKLSAETLVRGWEVKRQGAGKTQRRGWRGTDKRQNGGLLGVVVVQG